jgi:hypothetical protein
MFGRYLDLYLSTSNKITIVECVSYNMSTLSLRFGQTCFRPQFSCYKISKYLLVLNKIHKSRSANFLRPVIVSLAALFCCGTVHTTSISCSRNTNEGSLSSFSCSSANYERQLSILSLRFEPF